MSAVTILGVEVALKGPGIFDVTTPLGRVTGILYAGKWLAAWSPLSQVTNLRPVTLCEGRDLDAVCRGADHVLATLLAIGRAQGLRDAAGIAHERTSLHAAFGRDPHPADRNIDVREDLAIEAANIEALITAAAERAERGGGG